MVSVNTQQAAWNELLDVERAARYYEQLSQTYQKRHRYLMYAIAGCAAASIFRIALSSIFTANYGIITDCLIISISIFSLLSDFSRKASNLHAISVMCYELLSKHKALWLRIKNKEIEDKAAFDTLMSYIESGERATSIPGWSDIPIDKTLNAICQMEADKSLVDELTIKEV